MGLECDMPIKVLVNVNVFFSGFINRLTEYTCSNGISVQEKLDIKEQMYLPKISSFDS